MECHMINNEYHIYTAGLDYVLYSSALLWEWMTMNIIDL